MSKASKIISMGAILLLMVLAVSLSPANVVKATCYPDVWVAPPPLGNDANPGTQTQPFATIQHGLNAVCGDGTVHVAAGTYYENLSIDDGENLVGAGAPVTIIDGSHCSNGCGAVIEISSAPSANCISGFTIQGGYTTSGSIWDPAKAQVLYAGVKLPAIKMFQQFVNGGICGGGIYITETHVVTLNDCTVKDNEASSGGGICNHGKLYMNRCTVSGNTAWQMGGGIFNSPGFGPETGKMWLTNCTISGNSVTESLPAYNKQAPIFRTAIVHAAMLYHDGGGIYNSGTMELLNCTIANNSAYGRGGGFVNSLPDTAIFKNTIVANNTAGTSGTNNCYNAPTGVITSLGHNLDSENSCQFSGTGDLINTDPLLGPLQNNGGPTFTCALPIISPAVDAGDNNSAPTTDQRGVSRPQGLNVDIGAFELEGGAVPTVPENPNYSPPMPNTNRYLNQANMSVQFVSVNPHQATANQPVTISTNVVNTGDQGGNLSVALKINGQVEETRMVSVGPQASQPIKFTVTKAQPGTYSIDIGGQTGSFTIPDTGSHRAPVNAGLIAFIIVGVLILATVMVLLLSRRPA